jgi:phage shock protein PspC (stress-responsive transcriptional regulator)
MEKIFRRDKSRKVLGGVCAGLGRWTDTDPILWKLIFLFGFICPGCPAFLIYILMWIVVPEE